MRPEEYRNTSDFVNSSDFHVDHWTWDRNHKSPQVVLSSSGEAAYFHVGPLLESSGTAGVRGSLGFVEGEHYWEVQFIEPPGGSSVMVGVGTKHAQLDSCNYVNLIGGDHESWGLSYKGRAHHGGASFQYCQPMYDTATRIGVHLTLHGQGTLTFYQDGRSLGPAFSGLANRGPIYPIIASTAPSTELEVGLRVSRYLSLQDKCYYAIARTLRSSDAATQLPLPSSICRRVTAAM